MIFKDLRLESLKKNYCNVTSAKVLATVVNTVKVLPNVFSVVVDIDSATVKRKMKKIRSNVPTAKVTIRPVMEAALKFLKLRQLIILGLRTS